VDGNYVTISITVPFYQIVLLFSIMVQLTVICLNCEAHIYFSGTFGVKCHELTYRYVSALDRFTQYQRPFKDMNLDRRVLGSHFSLVHLLRKGRIRLNK
jgi:hypothetical protein